MFCGKRDEFKRGRRTIEKSKNGPVREKSKTAKNKQIEKDRVSTFWYFFVVFDVFFSHFYRFSICLRKTKGKKTQNIVFLLFGFLMFLVFLGFLFDFSRPKTCTDKKIPNVTSNRLRKNGNLDFFFLNHEVFWCSKCWSNPIRSEKSNSFSRWRTFWRRPWCQ